MPGSLIVPALPYSPTTGLLMQRDRRSGCSLPARRSRLPNSTDATTISDIEGAAERGEDREHAVQPHHQECGRRVLEGMGARR